MGRTKKYTTTYYERHREECLLKNKKYRAANKAKVQALQARWQASIEGKFSKYQARAKSKGFAFKLTLEEFSYFTKQPCAFCYAKGPNGIDRIDNSKGYIKENCQSCCKVCNKMKTDYNQEFFLKHIRKILDNRAI